MPRFGKLIALTGAMVLASNLSWGADGGRGGGGGENNGVGRGGGGGGGGAGTGGGGGGERGQSNSNDGKWTVTFLSSEQGAARVQTMGSDKKVFYIKGSDKLTEVTGLKTLKQAQGSSAPTGEWVVTGALIAKNSNGIIADSIAPKDTAGAGRGAGGDKKEGGSGR